MCYSVPDSPIKDKGLIVKYLVSIVINECRNSFGKKECKMYLDILKNISDKEMEKLYNGLVSQLNNDISSYINKSVKISYGISGVYDLSLEEKSEFITDLREGFKKYEVFEAAL